MALTRAENAVAEHLMRPLCPLLQFAAAVEAQVSGQPLWFCHDTHLVALRKSKFVQGESEPLKPVRSRFDGLGTTTAVRRLLRLTTHLPAPNRISTRRSLPRVTRPLYLPGVASVRSG